MSYSTQTPHKIALIANNFRTEEGVGSGVITPGDLVAKNSGGAVVVHPTAGGPAELAFALEDRLQGNGIDDAYADGDRITYGLFQPGDVIYARLQDGQVATKASYLTSAGDGTLKVASGGDTRLAKSEEAVDLSNSAAAVGRIKVRVL